MTNHTETLRDVHLSGRCEPIGDDLRGSSAQVLAGAEGIPGLEEALGALPDHG